ncbi:Galactose-binding protein regulator [Variovorax sp. SRS16]|uniref:LysR family transcriptional regulator n=1 Tax=Variovorax sp. SRS16 TaxID=282217 RepID=UPI00131954C2|nr:LysR family transcriptional regulator [Variovorax sp. SRS16]VTU24122.1 Galactose-binding protein regulator [Variovorax sp. SRS16]
MRETASVLLNRILARGKFRHIQVLLKVAELGSVQRAAEQIGMAQPSVTQTLAGLESLLQTTLFERHARGVRPTPACLDLLPVARQLMQGAAEGAEIVFARQDEGASVVRVVASASAMNGILLNTLPALCRASPAIRIQIREAEGDDLLLAMTRGEVDVVVCRRPAVLPDGWSFMPVQDDRLAVICAASHRLAAMRRVTWRIAWRERWLLSPAGSIARQVFDGLCEQAPADVSTHPVVTRSHTLIRRLLDEEGLLGFVPWSFVRDLLDAGAITELPLPGVPPMPGLGVLARHGESRDSALRMLRFLAAIPTTSHRQFE